MQKVTFGIPGPHTKASFARNRPPPTDGMHILRFNVTGRHSKGLHVILARTKEEIFMVTV